MGCLEALRDATWRRGVLRLGVWRVGGSKAGGGGLSEIDRALSRRRERSRWVGYSFTAIHRKADERSDRGCGLNRLGT